MPILLRLIGFLRPYRGLVLITALAAAGVMATSLTLPYLTGRVIDEVLLDQREDRLWPLVGAILAASVARFAFAVVRRTVSGRVSLGVEYDVRGLLFGHLSRMSLSYFDRMSVGQLMSRASTDLQIVRFFVGYGLVFLFMNAFTLILVTLLMLLIDWQLALLSLAMGPALLTIAWRYTRRSNPVLLDVQQRIGEVAQVAEESAVGIRVIKAFGRESDRSRHFGRTATRAFDRSIDAAHIRALYQPAMSFVPALGLAVVLFVGGLQTIDGRLTLGEFVTFYLYLALLMAPFRSLGTLVGNAQRAIAGGRRIFEVLDEDPGISQAPDAVAPPAGSGHVRFEGTSFGYEGAPDLLRSVDLDIPAGRTVALIGATASGKTTLTQLVPRFYDPDAGRVLLDGVDVRSLRLDDLRREVGIVPQDPFLFSASVRDNIAFGRPDATDDEVRGAARLARAADFVDALPRGFATRIGERGFTLSGGQRQRIAIARAILSDPRVLILDEATASVDASTEREIHDALRAVTRDRTTIIIAHRASTIALADELVVLEEGRIVARGRHEDLYSVNDLYREIYDSGLTRPDFVGVEE